MYFCLYIFLSKKYKNRSCLPSSCVTLHTHVWQAHLLYICTWFESIISKMWIWSFCSVYVICARGVLSPFKTLWDPTFEASLVQCPAIKIRKICTLYLDSRLTYSCRANIQRGHISSATKIAINIVVLRKMPLLTETTSELVTRNRPKMLSEKGKTFICILYCTSWKSCKKNANYFKKKNFIKTAYCQIRLSLSQCSMRIIWCLV
jgi:hypothetical protein